MREFGEEVTKETEIRTETAEREEIEALRKALAEEKQKAEGYLANWQRATADLINYKRRAEQEMAETSVNANAALALNLLPILDDMDRAFNSLPPELATTGWVEGVKLIERKLRATLEAQGLAVIKAVGEPFDPRFHEAVKQGKGKDGIVVEEVQKGYKFRDKVIRPSKVVVGDGDEGQAGEH